MTIRFEFDKPNVKLFPDVVPMLEKAMRHAASFLHFDEGWEATVKVGYEIPVRNAQGVTNTMGYEGDPKHEPIDVRVDLDQTVLEIISVLGHEMVHVYQCLRGDLTHDLSIAGSPALVWKKERIDARGFMMKYGSQRDASFNSPWEKEAYHTQPVIFDDFLKGLSEGELRTLAGETRPYSELEMQKTVQERKKRVNGKLSQAMVKMLDQMRRVMGAEAAQKLIGPVSQIPPDALTALRAAGLLDENDRVVPVAPRERISPAEGIKELDRMSASVLAAILP